MPKAILEFTLPEERHEHLTAVHGMDLALNLWNIDQELRGLLHHGHKFTTPDEALEHIRNFLHEQLENDCIDLETLVQ